MNDAPKPVAEYVLTVRDPVDGQTEVTRDPDTGTLTLGGFRRTSSFVSASTPFPTPSVGDEIELVLSSSSEVARPLTGGPATRVVTRVRHRIEASPDKVRCIMTVETRRG